MMSITSKKLIYLRENMNNSQQEMATLLGVDEKEWLSWELGEEAPNYKKLGQIILTMVFQGKIFIGSNNAALVCQKLTKAKHFNEKLADSAIGADSTLHQCIDEELAQVIELIK